jgi:hypothetical protein
MKKTMIVAAALSVSAAAAWAGGHFVPPVKDPLTLKECSACHMAFQPAFLPARSWSKMMAELPKHFGEDASLPEADARKIEAYLVSLSGDARSGAARAGRYMQGIAREAAPLRITETPWFKRKHEKKGRIAPATLAKKKLKSPAQCAGCHAGAEKGFYDED